MEENTQAESKQPEMTPSESMPEMATPMSDTPNMESKKGGNNKIVIILAVLIVICIICSVVGFLVSGIITSQLSTISDTIEEQIQDEIDDISNDVTTTPDETRELVSNRPSTSKASDFTLFSEGDISIYYPSDWTEEASLNEAILFQALSPTKTGDEFSENVNISTESIAVQPDITLDEYVDLSLTNLEASYSTINYINQGETVLAGRLAYEIVYTIDKAEVGLPTDAKVLQVITLVDDEAYIFTYTGLTDGYSQFINDVNYMINTFKVN